MAEFCSQCTKELFNENRSDFEGECTEDDNAHNWFAEVLCEGCGFTNVDYRGRCVGVCEKGHDEVVRLD